MQILDLRDLACPQRRARVFQTFDALDVGEGFEFVNDHAPTSLYHKFCQLYPNQFSWEYVEQGPEVWRLIIRRSAAGEAIPFQTDASLTIQHHTGEQTNEDC